MKNLNLLFNKTYYRNIGDKNAFEKDCQIFNQEICNVQFNKARDYRSMELPAERMQTFELVTTYPGMLVGTGYAHGTSISDNDIKIGFSFDYVTGQPYVPGSSVKGLLRCVFREQPEAAAEIIRACTGKELTVEDIKELEKKSFIKSGDIFLDAVVCEGNAKGNLLGLDNITPHSEPTKNPIPLLLLKILPGVHFEFRFVLKDDSFLTAAEKVKVFETMLILFGAGAKTNVGYGQLVRVSDYTPPRAVNPAPAPAQNSGYNRGGYNGNRNNTNGSRSGNRSNARTSSAQSPAIPQKLPCPRCSEETWVYIQNTKEFQTRCFKCGRNNIDMGQAVQKYLNRH